MRSFTLWVGLFPALLLSLSPPAEACGVKLTVRVQPVSRRSAHPSTVHVYLYKTDASKAEPLRRVLREAGHQVVVINELQALRAVENLIVFTELKYVRDVRRTYPLALVLPVASSAHASVSQLEVELKKRAS